MTMSHTYRQMTVFCGLAFIGIFASPVFADEAAALQGDKLPANAVWLESLDRNNIEQDWGSAQARRSVEGHPIAIDGKKFSHGVGTHARSEAIINLKGAATRFVSMVGIDDDTRGAGAVNFQVIVDDKVVAESGVMHGKQAAKLLVADLRGAKTMKLLVLPATEDINYGHADWAGAMLELAADATAKPETVELPQPAPPAIVCDDSPKPAIHTPRITGSTPGRPFLFLIPATGKAPLSFSASNLPEGLSLDAATGIISGSLKKAGTTVVELTAKNELGEATGKLTIVGGQHKLALTPPMGWNSWNCWAGAVSDKRVREAADAMVNSGLAAHGFQYVNIDDCWEDKRADDGEIRSNANFPDMKALADYVHSKGLKLGIYSSPGPKTCAGFEASWKHEQQDANTYAKWGVDYLKYDWCSYGGIAPNPDRKAMIEPYRVMRAALDNCNRDILFSFCQYGMGDVWTWGAETGGNCWRTTGDISDSWNSMAGIGFGQAGHERYAGPGHWNDPDMLVVGKVGWGPSLHKTHLKPNAQMTHISLWCLLAAPLLIGCDMTQMDDFTLALLTNSEVLAVNQDPLGKQAAPVLKIKDKIEVWARPLADGTMAVGLFNCGKKPTSIKVTWADLKLSGPQAVRDLWMRKDLGRLADGYEATVPPRGVVLVKVGEPKQ